MITPWHPYLVSDVEEDSATLQNKNSSQGPCSTTLFRTRAETLLEDSHGTPAKLSAEDLESNCYNYSRGYHETGHGNIKGRATHSERYAERRAANAFLVRSLSRTGLEVSEAYLLLCIKVLQST